LDNIVNKLLFVRYFIKIHELKIIFLYELSLKLTIKYFLLINFFIKYFNKNKHRKIYFKNKQRRFEVYFRVKYFTLNKQILSCISIK
jgi:hypothetical protein